MTISERAVLSVYTRETSQNGPKVNIRTARKIAVFDVLRVDILHFCKPRGHQMATKWPASGHQADTYKNDKNEKNVKKYTLAFLFIQGNGPNVAEDSLVTP